MSREDLRVFAFHAIGRFVVVQNQRVAVIDRLLVMRLIRGPENWFRFEVWCETSGGGVVSGWCQLEGRKDFLFDDVNYEFNFELVMDFVVNADFRVACLNIA